MVINFITSYSPSYLAKYKVLESSIKRFHPNAVITTVPLERIPRDKALCILEGLDKYDAACFVGADTELFGPIDLWEYDVVAIPHFLRPLPIDDNRPNVRHLHMVGALNADFIYANQNNSSIEILQWFDRQCQKKCVENFCEGYCNEQGYLGMLPFMFERFTALRDMTYNVAYWNCFMYNLRKERGEWVTDGGRLKLFHYSGYTNPEQMSYHQDRYKATGDILEFFKRYDNLLTTI